MLLRALPRRIVSRAVGAAARAPLPRSLLRLLLGVYASIYDVALEEAERPLGAYASFADFFTRRLKPGARPLCDDPLAIAAPCDGRVHAAGEVRAARLLQAKGRRYALSALLGFPRAHGPFEGGSQLTIHLAPGDYHRFHWPFDGLLDEVRAIPGDLWPVHPAAAATLPGLFVRNARVVVLGHRTQGGRFALVAVGALNVGSIRLTEEPLRTNRGEGARPRRWRVAHPVRRGGEAGFFELGSTVVLVLDRRAGVLCDPTPGTSVRMGQAVGRLAPSRRGGNP